MKKFLHFILILSFYSCATNAQAPMQARIVKDSLFIPWEIIYGPDDHIWFTQKNGYICRLDPVSGHTDTLYHETSTAIQGEGGMLGMVLHPDFPNPPFVYVAYNYLQGNVYKERVVKYQYISGALQSPQTVIDDIDAASIHNGCRLMMIGNMLYISTGDASTASVAQNVQSVNGKILRIVQDGQVPPDNPIPGNPVWSWGHRNAQGMVYANNRIYSSEHGPANDDELNIIEKGRNYGWPAVHGFCNTPQEITFCNDSNVVEPLIAWTPTLAVSGIDYYDHPMFPQFQQCIIMATLKDSKLYRLKLNSTFDGVDSSLVISGVNFGRLRDVCISPEGSIFISTSNSSASGSGAKVDRIIELYDPSFTRIGETVKDAGMVEIFPNPAQDRVVIQVKVTMGGETLGYSIRDMEGRPVREGRLLKENNDVDVRSLAAGAYLVTVSRGKDIIKTEKIIRR